MRHPIYVEIAVPLQAFWVQSLARGVGFQDTISMTIECIHGIIRSGRRARMSFSNVVDIQYLYMTAWRVARYRLGSAVQAATRFMMKANWMFTEHVGT